MNLTREQFEEQRHRRFGATNPERMSPAYWEWMVREGSDPYFVREQLGADHPARGGRPDWCFNGRMGSTRTEMPDGQTICVGGEHEDYYDPDFCIYNDVVVLDPAGGIEIYGYPEGDFPPTDFHTATPVEGQIYLIGRLGYADRREPGATPIYRLDASTYRIEPIVAAGDNPGWIFEHEAEYDPALRAIVVKGGKTIVLDSGKQRTRKNVEEYRLSLPEMRWQRLTDRSGWRQFSISFRDRSQVSRLLREQPSRSLADRIFQPKRVPHEPQPAPDFRTRAFSIDGVQVLVEKGIFSIEILIQGILPDRVTSMVIEDIAANLAEAGDRPTHVAEHPSSSAK